MARARTPVRLGWTDIAQVALADYENAYIPWVPTSSGPPPSRPTSYPLTPEGPVITKEYQAVCQQLGIRSVEVRIARFEAFLAEQQWPIFPFEEVEKYLNAVCPPGHYVRWKALTFEDVQSSVDSLYSRLIPLRVLQRIQVIRVHFTPQEAPVYISDFAVSRPDPFAAVIIGEKRWVFDVWDEPGF